MGVLDTEALTAALAEDPSATLALLADMTTATDEQLRAAVRRVAARLVLDRAKVGRALRTGPGRPRQVPASLGGDVDVDASLDAVLTASAERRPPSLDELFARDWGRPDLALAVVVDHSGSMNGERLAAAAVAAAAVAVRAPGEHAVVAFARESQVLRALTDVVPATTTVERVLRLRGHGTTSVASGLKAAADQLAVARSPRRVVLLLSDCRVTDEVDPLPVARGLAELVILAPPGDSEEAARLAAGSGARWAEMGGPDTVPGLLDDLLGR